MSGVSGMLAKAPSKATDIAASTPAVQGATTTVTKKLQDSILEANIAADAEKSDAADALKKDRVRVKRQAQIDILTDKPGRGGTILTDDFTYKV